MQLPPSGLRSAGRLSALLAAALAACGELADPARRLPQPPLADAVTPARFIVDAHAGCEARLWTRNVTLIEDGQRLLLVGTAVRPDPSCPSGSGEEAFVAAVDVAALVAGAGPVAVARDVDAEAYQQVQASARVVWSDGSVAVFSGREVTERVLRLSAGQWQPRPPLLANDVVKEVSQATRLSGGEVLVVRALPGEQPFRLESVRFDPAAGVFAPLDLAPIVAGDNCARALAQRMANLRAVELPAPAGATRVLLLGNGREAMVEGGRFPDSCAPDPSRPRFDGRPLVRLPVRRSNPGYGPGSLLLIGDAREPDALWLYDPEQPWRKVGQLPWRPVNPTAVVLPDGVIAIIGGQSEEDRRVIYVDPRTFDLAAGTAALARLRGNPVSAVLLPTGQVFVAAGKEPGKEIRPVDADFQILDPPYVGRPRPAIARVSAERVGFGERFRIELEAPVRGEVEVVMLAFGATLGGQNISQSLIELAHTIEPGGTALAISAPARAAWAAPGRYLVFVVAGGVPSRGRALGLE